MNKIFLSIFSMAYILTFAIVMAVVNEGYKLSYILPLTGMFLLIFVFYFIGSIILKGNKNPIKTGAVWGAAIGLISFLGSLNWYRLCYLKWCDPLQAIKVFYFIGFPFQNFWWLFGLKEPGFAIAVLNFFVILSLGILFGYLHKKGMKQFWYSLIAFIIIYIILGLIALARLFSSFG